MNSSRIAIIGTGCGKSFDTSGLGFLHPFGPDPAFGGRRKTQCRRKCTQCDTGLKERTHPEGNADALPSLVSGIPIPKVSQGFT